MHRRAAPRRRPSRRRRRRARRTPAARPLARVKATKQDGRDGGRGQPRSRVTTDQYGGIASYHSPRRRKARQKAALRRCSSSDASMSGVMRTSVPGVNSTISPTAYSRGRAVGSSSRLRAGDDLLAHGDDDLRFDDGDLAAQVLEAARLGLGVVAHVAALEDVGAVELQRVDAQALAALHDRRAGAAEERHALVALARLRLVLEQHDVGQRMAGADHRHRLAVRAHAAAQHLAGELVDLGDGASQVLVVDLVGLSHRSPFRSLPLYFRAAGEILRSLAEPAANRAARGARQRDAPPSRLVWRSLRDCR